MLSVQASKLQVKGFKQSLQLNVLFSSSWKEVRVFDQIRAWSEHSKLKAAVSYIVPHVGLNDHFWVGRACKSH